MTNLDYVKTFDDDKMAELITNPEIFIPKIYIYGYTSTKGGIQIWLNKDHGVPDPYE